MNAISPSLGGATVFENMIGYCDAMLAVFDQIERAASVDTTILVRGESGTGKELVAQAIHRRSQRRAGPFVAINVAAVPETLIESELFGHTSGAFTGANNRVGRVEAAQHGTLFVDEIGDVKLANQVKLLRVLENHLITPVGSNETREVDVRMVFATNRNLEQMVAAGKFRGDLYYRINVAMISLPPLRQRHGDIPYLVEHFLDNICTEKRKPRPTVTAELMHFLESYGWPGNVRQLYSCLESMVIFATSPLLTTDDLPSTVRNARPEDPGPCTTCQEGTLAQIVKQAVLHRLQRCAGNRTKAARSLGVSARTLQRRLKDWNGAEKNGKGAVAEFP